MIENIQKYSSFIHKTKIPLLVLTSPARQMLARTTWSSGAGGHANGFSFWNTNKGFYYFSIHSVSVRV
ncbi:MAG: hypothetical protein QME52_04305 [Bacteroidota bacterium]|nr:hypothetical protein [Bacteroidota bacterium]